jgi:hypothetical protein
VTYPRLDTWDRASTGYLRRPSTITAHHRRTINRRPRTGCIDYRRSKVKCHEIRPSHGTCKRRGRVCQGYINNKARNHKHHLVKAASSPRSADETNRRSRSPSCTATVVSTGSSSQVMMSFQVTAPPLDRRSRSISGDAPQNLQYGLCL